MRSFPTRYRPSLFKRAQSLRVVLHIALQHYFAAHRSLSIEMTLQRARTDLYLLYPSWSSNSSFSIRSPDVGADDELFAFTRLCS